VINFITRRRGCATASDTASWGFELRLMAHKFYSIVPPLCILSILNYVYSCKVSLETKNYCSYDIHVVIFSNTLIQPRQNGEVALPSHSSSNRSLSHRFHMGVDIYHIIEQHLAPATRLSHHFHWSQVSTLITFSPSDPCIYWFDVEKIRLWETINHMADTIIW
jgi:hypothetical protein